MNRKIISITLICSLLYLPTNIKAANQNDTLSNYSNYTTFSALENIMPDKKITILFPSTVDENSVNNNTIELIDDSTGENVSIDINLTEEKKVEIFHDQLKDGQSYHLIIHNSITDIQHKAIGNGAIYLIKVASDKSIVYPSGTNDLYVNSTDDPIIDLYESNFKFSCDDNPQIAFIKKLECVAVKTYNDYKVLPSITLSQAILETGWGKSDKALKCNNFFGIKANGSWTGKTMDLPTREWQNGSMVAVMAKWRVYDSVLDSLEDHGKFLSNSYYKNAGLFKAKNYKEQAEALRKAGYSTDPNYAKSLCNIIERYDLWQYDPNGVNLN